MTDEIDMARIVEPLETVSDRIRALAAAGYERARIARFLGKRYQHVRNVLEQDKLKREPAQAGTRPGFSEAEPTSFSTDGVAEVHRLDLQSDGSIRLPPVMVQAMGLRRGGVVISEFKGDRLVLLSTAAALKKAQELVSAFIPPGGPSLVDDLIAERRREAQRELEGD